MASHFQLRLPCSIITRLWSTYQKQGSTHIWQTANNSQRSKSIHTISKLRTQNYTTPISTAHAIPGMHPIPVQTIRTRLCEGSLRSRRPLRNVTHGVVTESGMVNSNVIQCIRRVWNIVLDGERPASVTSFIFSYIMSMRAGMRTQTRLSKYPRPRPPKNKSINLKIVTKCELTPQLQLFENLRSVEI